MSRIYTALVLLGTIIVFFVISKTWTSETGWLPYPLLFLLCPLLHLFMHRKHEGHGREDNHQ
jgi:hypothetical protein